MTAEERKQHPVYSGVLQYFPDAIMAVANCSWKGNEQHNPGTELHWDRAKSGDEKDALVRHLMQSGTVDNDGVRHSAKVAWRALAMLQKEIEADMEEAIDPVYKATNEWRAGDASRLCHNCGEFVPFRCDPCPICNAKK